MGIRYFVFAVNKMDLVGYDEKRFNEIVEQINELSSELSLPNITIIPVSATAVSYTHLISALGVTLIATVIAVMVNTFFGICAAWLLTKFSFKGKQVLATLIDIPFSISPVIVGLAYLMTFGRLGWTYPAIRWINDMLGTNIRITFAVPGVVLATIFVTFPFVSRELIPVLNAQGKDEEEAAALMGAKGFTIFRRITPVSYTHLQSIRTLSIRFHLPTP